MPGPSSLYMVIDQGGHASRAVIFNQQRQIVSMKSVAVVTLRRDTGCVEHDAEALIASIQGAIEGAVVTLGNRAGDIVSTGVATQRSSIVCWHKGSGVALSPVISWQDRRTAAAIHAYADQSEAIHRLTGLMLSPHYGATKMQWCLDNLPNVQQAFRDDKLCCGPLSSFILFRIVKERPFVVDPANASRTLLWNYHTADWEPELLQLFDVPINILPRCVPNRYDYGHITIRSRAIPVTVATGDQSAALFAFGKPETDTTYINMGTGAFLQRPVGSGPVAANNLLSSVVWQSPDETVFVLEGTVNGAGSALQQFAAGTGTSEQNIYKNIEKYLASISAPPLFLNGISGLGSPFWAPDFQSGFIGAGGQTERVVAVLESIVFLIAANLDEMTSVAGPSKILMVSGGLSAVDGLCQRLADLTDVRVKRPQLKEATAHGAAYLLSGITGTAVPATNFQPAPIQALQQRYQKWLIEMKRNMPGVRI